MKDMASSYRRLYRQDFTLPLGPLAQYVGNVPLNFGHITTFGAIALVVGIVYTMILGNYALFGFNKIIWIIAISLPITWGLFRLDTCGMPLHTFLFSMIKFPFSKQWSVAFQPIKKPSKRKIKWNGTFRAVRLTDDSHIEHMQLPLEGVYSQLEGIKLMTSGATRLEISPLSKNMKVSVGKYDSLKPETKRVKRLFKTVVEVGKGDVQIVHRQGEKVLIYKPDVERERGITP